MPAAKAGRGRTGRGVAGTARRRGRTGRRCSGRRSPSDRRPCRAAGSASRRTRRPAGRARATSSRRGCARRTRRHSPGRACRRRASARAARGRVRRPLRTGSSGRHPARMRSRPTRGRPGGPVRAWDRRGRGPMSAPGSSRAPRSTNARTIKSTLRTRNEGRAERTPTNVGSMPRSCRRRPAQTLARWSRSAWDGGSVCAQDRRVSRRSRQRP